MLRRMSNEPQQPNQPPRNSADGAARYPAPQAALTDEQQLKKYYDEMHARIIEQLKTHKKVRTRSRWRPVD
jgi:hypothetical protein